ncbi:MAG: hypothetical protein KatS3mg103_0041 [Phycisphaerales bacterium]|nr:MAG: hypothetical protein KatS3mg103_0041 [Phycisphaerales bacterium]
MRTGAVLVSVLAGAVPLVAQATAHAQGLLNPYAAAVVEYVPGLDVPAGYDDPASALGEPTRYTGVGSFPGCVTPFNPPFLGEEIVSIGPGGHLTLRLGTPATDAATNPFGIDLLIFHNGGYIDSAFPAGVVGGTFFDGGSVELSADGVDFLPVPGVLAEGHFPTLGYLDLPTPFTEVRGAVPSDFRLPVDPSLDPAGMDWPTLLAAYAGSGGGRGHRHRQRWPGRGPLRPHPRRRRPVPGHRCRGGRPPGVPGRHRRQRRVGRLRLPGLPEPVPGRRRPGRLRRLGRPGRVRLPVLPEPVPGGLLMARATTPGPTSRPGARAAAATLAAFGLACLVGHAGAQDAWTHAGRDASRIALAEASALPDLTSPAWTFDAQGLLQPIPQATVVVSADGVGVVLGAIGDQAHALALDVRTGRELWRAPIDAPVFASWASPAVVGQRDQGLALVASGTTAHALDLGTGRTLWRQDLGQSVVNASPAIDADANLAWLTTYDPLRRGPLAYWPWTSPTARSASIRRSDRPRAPRPHWPRAPPRA